VSADQSIEIVRDSIDVWNRNDWAGLEAAVAPEVVIRAPEGWPETGIFKGWPAVRAQYKRLKDPWSEERLEIIDLEAVGEDRVLAHLRWVGQGKGSGLGLDMRSWPLYTVKAGRIARIEFYLDADAARRAAGLMG
jgi:ketosteroid isomerase-like protein